MPPNNFVAVQGQTAVSADMINTFVQWVPNATVLRSFIGTGNMTVVLLGISAIADGNQGIFYWDPNSTATDDNQNVIRPTGVTTGAWIRDAVSFVPPTNFPASGAVTAKCGQAYVALGAVTLNLSPSTSLSTSCVVYALAYGGAITITPLLGTDKINSGVAGASLVIPAGFQSVIYTDANGNFYVTISLAAGPGSPITLAIAPSAVASFSAHISGLFQAIPVSSATKMECSVVGFNNGSFYNNSLYRWTPPAGRVVLSVLVEALVLVGTSLTANSDVSLTVSLYKNGSALPGAILDGYWHVGSSVPASALGVNVSAIDTCNGSDYYEVFVTPTGTGWVSSVADVNCTFSGSEI